MLRSSTSTCGLQVRTDSSVPGTSPASSITLNLASDSSSTRNPDLTTRWSSARTIVIGLRTANGGRGAADSGAETARSNGLDAIGAL
jgi:hypothetical protein